VTPQDATGLRFNVEGTMKVYRGTRDAGGVGHVYIAEADKPDRLLDPRTDLFKHCLTGLDWGYSGPGPAQCALAMLADALDDELRAVRVHAGFRFQAITALPRHLPWELTADEVRAIVEDIEHNAAVG
jgi:hypothetical protein